MNRLGFTLIEAVVAVVLVALLGSLAGTGLDTVLQERDPAGLDAKIDEARREAILSGAPTVSYHVAPRKAVKKPWRERPELLAADPVSSPGGNPTRAA